MAREIITMQCTECKNRNYTSTKNKKTTTGRLELKKFCPHCRKHQVHKRIEVAADCNSAARPGSADVVRLGGKIVILVAEARAAAPVSRRSAAQTVKRPVTGDIAIRITGA